MIELNLGESLKRLRAERGLSQRKMAKECGIERSLIGHYELNKITPTLNNLVKLANFFDVSLDAFIKEV